MFQYFLVTCLVVLSGVQNDTPELTGVKCVVTGKAVHEKYSSKYKNGVLYFDCNSSRLKFKTEPSGFVTKANHQLVVTSQYIQAYCPIKTDVSIVGSTSAFQMAGVKIKTCCHKCKNLLSSKGKVGKQIDFVFGDKTFDKIFVPRPKHRIGKLESTEKSKSAAKR